MKALLKTRCGCQRIIDIEKIIPEILITLEDQYFAEETSPPKHRIFIRIGTDMDKDGITPVYYEDYTT